jgi:hypothetical protein
MVEIVNLRQARKRKRRSEAEASASANRVRHGRTAGDQLEARLERELQGKRLDGHRRAPDGDDDGGGGRST